MCGFVWTLPNDRKSCVPGEVTSRHRLRNLPNERYATWLYLVFGVEQRIQRRSLCRWVNITSFLMVSFPPDQAACLHFWGSCSVVLWHSRGWCFQTNFVTLTRGRRGKPWARCFYFFFIHEAFRLFCLLVCLLAPFCTHVTARSQNTFESSTIIIKLCWTWIIHRSICLTFAATSLTFVTNQFWRGFFNAPRFF